MHENQISEVIETFEDLSFEDKEFTFNLIEKNYINAKRNEIVQRVAEAKNNYKNGNVKKGNLKDLLEDLEND